jgi:glycosyltransferase involved in cell wall biosynthesis
MGIPTLTSFTPEFEVFLPDHPFVIVNPETLPDKLEQVITDGEIRRRKGIEGRRFVEKYHAAEKVVKGIYAIYRELGWVDESGSLLSGRDRT